MTKISDGVIALVQDDRIALYQNDEENLRIIEKPRKHYELTLQLKDKRLKTKKKNPIVMEKHYTYPSHLEEPVVWDAVHTMRNYMLEHRENVPAWNSTFGKSWPELLIPVEPTPPAPLEDRKDMA